MNTSRENGGELVKKSRKRGQGDEKGGKGRKEENDEMGRERSFQVEATCAMKMTVSVDGARLDCAMVPCFSFDFVLFRPASWASDFARTT